MFEYHPRSKNAQSYEMGPMVWKRMEIIESERKKSHLTLTVRAWRLYGEMIYKAVIIWQYSVITAVKPGIQWDQVVTKTAQIALKPQQPFNSMAAAATPGWLFARLRLLSGDLPRGYKTQNELWIEHKELKTETDDSFSV